MKLDSQFTPYNKINYSWIKFEQKEGKEGGKKSIRKHRGKGRPFYKSARLPGRFRKILGEDCVGIHLNTTIPDFTILFLPFHGSDIKIGHLLWPCIRSPPQL